MNEKIVRELQQALEEKTKEMDIIITELKDHLEHDLSGIMRKTEYHYCNNCGKTEIIDDDMDNEDAFIASNKWHLLGRMYNRHAGYGSKLDGENIVLELCDDCLTHMFRDINSKKEVEVYDKETEEFLNKKYFETQTNPYGLTCFDIEEKKQ